jgi:4-amino-4-deoxy-L-arabinose transferase-like glycosyltransferase
MGLNLVKEFQPSEKLLAIFLSGCAYLIFNLELAGFFNFLNKPIFILFLQAIILAVTLMLISRYKVGFPVIAFTNFKAMFQGAIVQVRRNIGASIFLSLIVLVYLFLAYLQVRFPQNTTDSLLNHLSRIGYWLQQGSLKPYNGFNNIGNIFPVISSLLMTWSVTFLRSEKLVGYVQFFAAILTAITIYSLGKELGYSRKSSLLAGLFFLTFPIVLFESVTSQNDLVVACFLIMAFYFLVRFMHKPDRPFLVFSILSFALSVGTKQYALFALPGYIGLFIGMLRKMRTDARFILIRSSIYATCTIILFSSFSYVQNWIYYGNPAGDKNSLTMIMGKTNQDVGTQKLMVNSLRLSYQFLSCEGFPPVLEAGCIHTKTYLLRPLLTSPAIDLESDRFLLDRKEPFRLDTRYGLNEESSWFGLVGGLIIVLAIPFGLVTTLKKKKIEGPILIVTSFIFFLLISFVKGGWDPYVGRYLIFPTALSMPISAGFLDNKKIFHTIILCCAGVFATFIMIFSVVNNDSRPLISQYQFLELQRWGKDHSVLVQKIAYKLTPFFRNDLDQLDIWKAPEAYIKTFSNQKYRIPLEMVEGWADEKSTLGILNLPGYTFPDYLFFGDSFGRKLAVFTNPEQVNGDHPPLDYLLISPDFDKIDLSGYVQLIGRDGWRLLQYEGGK